MLLKLMKEICKHNSLGLNFKKLLGQIKEKLLIAHNPKLTECYIHFTVDTKTKETNKIPPRNFYISTTSCEIYENTVKRPKFMSSFTFSKPSGGPYV